MPPADISQLSLRGPSQLVLADDPATAGGNSRGSGDNTSDQHVAPSWKHEPSKLITSSVLYVAQVRCATSYLGNRRFSRKGLEERKIVFVSIRVIGHVNSAIYRKYYPFNGSFFT